MALIAQELRTEEMRQQSSGDGWLGLGMCPDGGAGHRNRVDCSPRTLSVTMRSKALLIDWTDAILWSQIRFSGRVIVADRTDGCL
jgi:hypothetical protein